jgi:hypothetical protein
MPSNLSSMIADRVAETTTTTGTGTVTLAGAKPGYRSFSDAWGGVSAEVYYCITDGTDFEVGMGTFTNAIDELTRATVLSSSNWGSLVDWTAGAKDIFCTLPAGVAGKATETFEEAITVTVGTAANFSSIGEAIAYLSHLQPAYDHGGIPATIELQTGFVMAEQIAVSGIDLGWITITSVDPEVEIDETAITAVFFGLTALISVSSGTGPNIACLFANATGTAINTGIAVINGSILIAPGCGVPGCAGSGLYVEGTSRVMANDSVFSGGGIGIEVSGPSFVSADRADCSGSSYGITATGPAQVSAGNATLDDCSISACHAEISAQVDINGATAIGAGGDAVTASEGARISAVGAVLTGATGTAVVVSSGGIVVANGTGTVTLSQTENTITAAGIIFREVV